MSGNRLKLVVGFLVGMAAVGFAFTQWESPPPEPPLQPAPWTLSPEEREIRRQELLVALQLTEDQVQQINEIWDSPRFIADFDARREAMDAILTPEQQEILRANFAGYRSLARLRPHPERLLQSIGAH